MARLAWKRWHKARLESARPPQNPRGCRGYAVGARDGVAPRSAVRASCWPSDHVEGARPGTGRPRGGEQTDPRAPQRETCQDWAFDDVQGEEGGSGRCRAIPAEAPPPSPRLRLQPPIRISAVLRVLTTLPVAKPPAADAPSCSQSLWKTPECQGLSNPSPPGPRRLALAHGNNSRVQGLWGG